MLSGSGSEGTCHPGEARGEFKADTIHGVVFGTADLYPERLLSSNSTPAGPAGRRHDCCAGAAQSGKNRILNHLAT